MKNKNLKLSGIMLIGVFFIISFFYAINFQPVVIGGTGWFSTGGLNTFDSYSEFIDFLENNTYSYNGWTCYKSLDSAPRISVSQSNSGRNSIFLKAESEGKTIDYSKTNIQVEGVDEPDIVKTDGTYLYIFANSKIYIVKATPLESVTILSTISFEDDVYVKNFFINKDRLITFGISTRFPIIYEEYGSKNDYYVPYWNTISTTIVNIYDIYNRADPDLETEIEVDGIFFDARMIGNYVYVIATENTGNIYYKYEDNVTINIPEISINDYKRYISPEDIYYVNSSEKIGSMTHIISLDVFGDKVNEKSFLLGSSQNMYVSSNNIFLACQEYDYYYSFWEGSYNEEVTIIHKISIDEGEINYIAKGKVPGYTLNQFSMDEHNGFFRIATQKWSDSTTNLYILNKNMNRTSEIEGIAPGERMHSARFMGDKAYLVTFKKVDPFFTLDLSDPYNPKILGILKIPGYSDYLHPFDENHIIGIGKDTVESRSGDFAWYQGLKIALFDVSDFENPKEKAKIIIGDRGTDSPVLYEHKAFLFDREKQLLVIPVTLCEITDEIKEDYYWDPGNEFGKFIFQGAFVYKLSIVDGFELQGRITHMDDDEIPDDYRWYWGSSSSDIVRSLYINDVLYTISNIMVKMNNLNDLSEINSIKLN